MLLFQQADFVDRNNLPEFLNRNGLTKYGVEVGTHRGDFAEIILTTWGGKRLDCIDPWRNDPEYQEQSTRLWGGGNREDDYLSAYNKTQPFGERVRLIRDKSPQAAAKYPNDTLDFVYIDGDHRQIAVATDLWAWYPKLRKGGVLAGHDIVCPGEPESTNWGKEIQPAVMEFSRTFNLTCYLIIETQSLPWSYFFIRE